MTLCRRCFVSGQVQGVYFRASAQSEAAQRGISGYARNLPDARVEVLACGVSSSVDEFCIWLAQGPTHAIVSNLRCENVDETPPAAFTVE